jgi:hypothetical protein
LPIPPGDIQGIVNVILAQNETLQGCLRDRLDSARQIASVPMNEPDERMNLASFNAHGIALSGHQIGALRNAYRIQKLCQLHMVDDQFMYLLIFWTGSGGCGILQSERPPGATTLIQKF